MLRTFLLLMLVYSVAGSQPGLAEAGGRFPDADSAGVFESDRKTLTGNCAAICPSGLDGPSGTTDVSADGEVVECKPSGFVNVRGYDDVTVQCSNLSGVDSNGPAGTTFSLVVQYNNIACGGGGTKGIKSVNGTEGRSSADPAIYRGNDISDCEDGIFTDDVFMLIEDNYIHDLVGINGPGCDKDCHSDCIHLEADQSVVRNNTLDANPRKKGQGNTNSALFGNFREQVSDLVVDHNWLSGGNLTLYHIERHSTGAGQEAARCPLNSAFTNNMVVEDGWFAEPHSFTQGHAWGGTSTCTPTDHGGTWTCNVVDTGGGWCEDGRTGDECPNLCAVESACPAAPLVGCNAATKVSVSIDEKNPGAEKLKLSLAKFEGPIVADDLGDPRSDDGQYDVCIYDGADALVGSLVVAGGARRCAKKPCWSQSKKVGARYKDKAGFESGVQSLSMSGGAAGKGKIRIAGKNNAKKGPAKLPAGIAPALEDENSARIQLLAPGDCFDASFDDVKRADGLQFQAK